MNREACKFFSGSFAALGYAHAAYAVATSRGIINEPVFLGRRWGVGFMWSEAAIYTALAVALGYAGWGAGGHEHQRSIPGSAPAAVTEVVSPTSGP
ncbi:hypothetical protein [Mycolicibacterium rhodesiae]|uniref:hypothetical protein n=1 Tax=Mycolicibacterium rhodesiae TaxID=36814 RepID=UPI001F3CE05C|nr:hypothetical protein [Mycolicibacterium rhodesiae]